MSKERTKIMRKRIVKIVDDGTRFTVKNRQYIPSVKEYQTVFIKQHLNRADALNLVDTFTQGTVSMSKG